MTIEHIIEVIKEKLCVVMNKSADRVEWDISAPLAEHYELNSFMMIELLLSLESVTSFDIASVLPEYLKSIAALAAFINEASNERYSSS